MPKGSPMVGGAVFKDKFYPFDAPYDIREELLKDMEQDRCDRARNAAREAERVPLELEPVTRDPRQATFTLGGVEYKLSRVKDGFSLACEEPRDKEVYMPPIPLLLDGNGVILNTDWPTNWRGRSGR